MRYALREARQPCYFDAPGGRVAFVAAGSSNARLALAADIGIGDAGRPSIFLTPIATSMTRRRLAALR